MLAEVFVPTGGADERESFASFQRRSAAADIATDLLELTFTIDVRDDAARLRTPTLVVHRRGDRAIRFAGGEEPRRSRRTRSWWCSRAIRISPGSATPTS